MPVSFPFRGFFLSLLCLSSFGCGFLPTAESSFGFEPAPLTFKAEPAPAKKNIDREMATSLEDAFPFLRFQRLRDGRVRVFIPFPAGAGAQGALAIVQKNCECFQRVENPATIAVESGYVVRGDPAKAPWDSSHALSPTEDLFLVTGSREDIFETLEFIDLFFNNAPQIEIQVQIIEISDGDAFERGIENLTMTNLKDGLPFDQSTLSISGVDEDGNLIYTPSEVPTGTSGPFARSLNFNNAPSTLDAGGGFALAIIQSSFVLDAILKLVKTTSAADIVSRPRIVVRNGQAALLTSQEQIPYQKFTNINTSGNSASSLAMLNVGVNLRVLPVIIGSDTVHLSIDAQVSRVGRDVTVATGVTAPAISDRTAKTEVAVPSGQSVVIGGLKLLETKETETKIPLLGDIPGIGWLFSHRSISKANTEVLFIITPVIKTRGAGISRYGDIFDPFVDDAQK
jgi:type II secretory pathway component GspD/PulD (secretin)